MINGDEKEAGERQVLKEKGSIAERLSLIHISEPTRH